MDSQTYQKQLNDPRWKALAQKCKEMRNFTCQWCKAHNGDDELPGADPNCEVELHAHHPGYNPGAAPWEYPVEHLLCLCSGCHETLWHYKRSILKNLHELNVDQIQAVFSFIGFLQQRCKADQCISMEQVISEFKAIHIKSNHKMDS